MLGCAQYDCKAIDEQSITRRGDDCMTTESEFVVLADRVLTSIGAALDVAADTSDADLDWSLNDGILTIDCGDGGKVIVNRHVPNRELWVAAKSGGFHFKDDAGVWRDTRTRRSAGGGSGAAFASAERRRNRVRHCRSRTSR